jgi:hypothetical protein
MGPGAAECRGLPARDRGKDLTSAVQTQDTAGNAEAQDFATQPRRLPQLDRL